VHGLGRERALDHHVGRSEALGDVADTEFDALGDVGWGLGRGFDAGRDHVLVQ